MSAKNFFTRGYSTIGVIALVVSLWLAAKTYSQQPAQDDLQIKSQSGLRSYPLDRDEAIKIGLEQAAKQIDYLLLSAVGLLAFLVSNFVIERDEVPTQAAATRLPGWFQKTLGVTCIVLLASSILLGLMAYGCFAGLATSKEFSLYEEVGLLASGQLFTMGIATIAFGLICITRIIGS